MITPHVHLAFPGWGFGVTVPSVSTGGSVIPPIVEDAGQVALQLGNSARILLTHCRALVTRETAQEFWAINPPVSEAPSGAVPDPIDGVKLDQSTAAVGRGANSAQTVG